MVTNICLVILGSFAVFMLGSLVCSTLSDIYQCYRFNNRVCRTCGRRLIQFCDKYAPECRAFHCRTCGYTTYVSNENTFVDPELLKD